MPLGNMFSVSGYTLYYRNDDSTHRIDRHRTFPPPGYNFDIRIVFGTTPGSNYDTDGVVLYLHCATSNSTVFDKWYNGRCRFGTVVPSDNLDTGRPLVPSDTDHGRYHSPSFRYGDYRPWYWYNSDSIRDHDWDIVRCSNRGWSLERSYCRKRDPLVHPNHSPIGNPPSGRFVEILRRPLHPVVTIGIHPGRACGRPWVTPYCNRR